MSIFKCKMCGGDLEIAEGASVAECQYCGSKQTLPRFDSDRKRNLYDRAGHFRRNNEFDKAEGIYEQILNEDPTDAEAYWSLVLCRYGIEYVEDPTTHKRVPTVNRAQYTSVFADENYKKAIECADALQKSIYEDEAKAIDAIQKGILEISEKEEPFDVFICYKETDTQGRRTPDSVLANELYHELTKEGFKVFFSRITLEDKLGTAYEPYIFAALNSARVMVALGTKPEYFNAVWVKNEWSRYLALIRAGAKKNLIPAYRDMDPYDLPEEFSHLQAQDMSKLGFMPDLIRGVKKLLGTDEPKETVKETVVVQQSAGGANITAQLKRGMLALEDKDWTAADGFFDKALDMDAECAEAYFGKALAAHVVSTGEALVQKRMFVGAKTSEAESLTACKKDEERIKAAIEKYRIPDYLDASEIRGFFNYDQRTYPSMVKAWKKRISEEKTYWEGDRNLSRALRYAKGDFADTLQRYQSEIESRLKQRLAASEAEEKQAAEETAKRYAEAMEKGEKAVEERRKTVEQKKEADYRELCSRQENGKTQLEYEELAHRFAESKWKGYKDCAERSKQCSAEAERLKAAGEKAAAAKKKKKTTIGIIAGAVAIAAIVIVIIVTKVIIPANMYKAAEAQLASGDYDGAIAAFVEMGNYKNSSEMVREAKLQKADYLLRSGDYYFAYGLLSEIDREDIIINNKHDRAMALLDSGDYEAAYALLSEIGDDDSINANKRDRALLFMEDEKFDEAYELLNQIGDTATIDASKYERGISLLETGDYETAYALLHETGNDTIINENKYDRGMKLLEAGDYQTAYNLLTESGNEETVKNSKYDRAVAMLEKEEFSEAYALLTDINEIEMVNSSKYERAVKAISSRDYLLAYTLLSELNRYQDSHSLRKSIKFSYEKQLLKDAQVGSTIIFGADEKATFSRGKEEIEWLVLAKENNRLLVISKYILFDQPFDTSSDKYFRTWETCSLRTWLNDTFYKAAFSDEESSLIVKTTVTADKNPEYGDKRFAPSPGNNTQDKVFILSIPEAEKYFSSNSKRRCGRGESDTDFDYWLLRTVGENSGYVTEVSSDGKIYYSGHPYYSASQYGPRTYLDFGIRPAMWISLSY